LANGERGGRWAKAEEPGWPFISKVLLLLLLLVLVLVLLVLLLVLLVLLLLFFDSLRLLESKSTFRQR
jgi:hypothetical protein